jgi:hypothetical protein
MKYVMSLFLETDCPFLGNSFDTENCHFSLITMSGKRLSVERRAEIAAWYPTKSIGELAILFSLSKSSVHNIVKKTTTLEQLLICQDLDAQEYQLPGTTGV